MFSSFLLVTAKQFKVFLCLPLIGDESSKACIGTLSRSDLVRLEAMICYSTRGLLATAVLKGLFSLVNGALTDILTLPCDFTDVTWATCRQIHVIACADALVLIDQIFMAVFCHQPLFSLLTVIQTLSGRWSVPRVKQQAPRDACSL